MEPPQWEYKTNHPQFLALDNNGQGGQFPYSPSWCKEMLAGKEESQAMPGGKEKMEGTTEHRKITKNQIPTFAFRTWVLSLNVTYL